MTTIVISYQAGTLKMMDVCLGAIRQFTRASCEVVVLVREGTIDEIERAFFGQHGVKVVEVNVDLAPDVSSKVHGMMLDSYLPDSIDTEYVLTLDSDCFPVADGWLTDLLDMLKRGARVAGILHPWAPPSDTVSKNTIEWRVRSQHCWETTHVACQLTTTDDLRKLKALGALYNGGDDTGLLIPLTAKEQGWKVDGFKVTRCPKVSSAGNASGGVLGEIMDPEFNRYVCLVFGDKVYHHGGFSRSVSFGDEQVFKDSFGWVNDKVLFNGADWLLNDGWAYRFKLDREEEVAAEKMQRLFGMHGQRMKG